MKPCCDGISSQGHTTLLTLSGYQSEEQSLLQLLADITTVPAGVTLHCLRWNAWHKCKADVKLIELTQSDKAELSRTSPRLAWDNDNVCLHFTAEEINAQSHRQNLEIQTKNAVPLDNAN